MSLSESLSESSSESSNESSNESLSESPITSSSESSRESLTASPPPAREPFLGLSFVIDDFDAMADSGSRRSRIEEPTMMNVSTPSSYPSTHTYTHSSTAVQPSSPSLFGKPVMDVTKHQPSHQDDPSTTMSSMSTHISTAGTTATATHSHSPSSHQSQQQVKEYRGHHQIGDDRSVSESMSEFTIHLPGESSTSSSSFIHSSPQSSESIQKQPSHHSSSHTQQPVSERRNISGTLPKPSPTYTINNSVTDHHSTSDYKQRNEGSSRRRSRSEMITNSHSHMFSPSRPHGSSSLSSSTSSVSSSASFHHPPPSSSSHSHHHPVISSNKMNNDASDSKHMDTNTNFPPKNLTAVSKERLTGIIDGFVELLNEFFETEETPNSLERLVTVIVKKLSAMMSAGEEGMSVMDRLSDEFIGDSNICFVLGIIRIMLNSDDNEIRSNIHRIITNTIETTDPVAVRNRVRGLLHELMETDILSHTLSLIHSKANTKLFFIKLFEMIQSPCLCKHFSLLFLDHVLCILFPGMNVWSRETV